MTTPVLSSAISRSQRRLLPFLLLMYVVAFLDRSNIGFAKLPMQRATGLSELAYAWGAGLFFLPYALCEIPSNLMMQKLGARIWMSRIMVSWGLVSVSFIFVRGTTSFYALRFLLGLAEAGFFPGVILYLTNWFPDEERGRALGLFYLGAPVALMVGAPVSGLLLKFHTPQMQGWQWMFLGEGSLAIAVGVWAFFVLRDHPGDAPWLSASEKCELQRVLKEEESERRRRAAPGLLLALRDPILIHMALIYLMIQMAVYAVVFYLPAQVARLMHDSVGLKTGFVQAIPWLCALVATALVPRWAATSGAKRKVVTLILAMTACASMLYLSHQLVASMVAICVGASGLIAVQPIFWTLPATYLSGRAAAGGIAFINACGAVGGLLAPNVKAHADQHFHSPHAGLFVLAGFTLLTAGLTAVLKLPTVHGEWHRACVESPKIGSGR